MYKYLVMRVN
nr:unnamed protein product [Callosobruchus analis]